MRKIFLLCFILLIIAILAAPFLTLFFPASMRDFVYRTYIMNVISKNVAGDADSEQLVAERILDFLYSNNYVTSNTIPVDATPLNDLLSGSVYCDQLSNTLNNLLMYRGIDAGLVMYQNHSVSRVMLNSEWRIMDPLYGILLKDSHGGLATMQQIINKDKSFTSRQKGDLESKYFINSYNRIFTAEKHIANWNSPRVSMSGARKIIRKIINSYFVLLGRWYFKPYRDAYLVAVKQPLHETFDLTNPEEAQYYRARTYHLCGELRKAVKYYAVFMERYPGSKYVERAALFRVSVMMRQGNWKQARKLIKRIIVEKPESKWNGLAKIYLDWCKYHLDGAPIPEGASDVAFDAFYFRK